MLKINESITITGECKIDDKTVVTMIASITTNGVNCPNTSYTVLDNGIYTDNMETCQSYIAAFNTKVFEKQKQILGGNK